MLSPFTDIDAGFLTETWHIENNGTFAASCIGVVLLVVCLEAMRRLSREFERRVLQGWRNQAQAQVVDGSGIQKDDHSPLNGRGKPSMTRAVMFRASPLQQLVRAIFHAAILGLAYAVMLLVMSFNGYIIICVLIGAGVGKFICDWMTIVISVTDGEDGLPQNTDEEPTGCCG